MCGRKMEGDAAVAGAVIVAALVARAGVAEQERARVQNRRARIPPIPERSFDDGRDRGLFMALFKGTIIRTGGADVFAHAPFRCLKQRAGNRGAAGTDVVIRSHGTRLAIFPKPGSRGSAHMGASMQK